MSDPLKALLEAGAVTPRFAPNSRYYGIEIATLEGPDGRPVVHLQRRMVPAPERFDSLEEHTVTAGERLDRVAATALGDPELFWRLCDANGAVRPDELTEEPGRVLRVPLPEGIPGSRDG